MNVYELWLRYKDDPGGLWVQRNSWASLVARVHSVGALTGLPPYYGNPNPEVIADVYKLDGSLVGRQKLRCPGTYAYRRIDAPGWSA